MPAYTYSPPCRQFLLNNNRPNFLPVFMVEASYEDENSAGTPGIPQVLRSQEYWSNLSGATGQLFGNRFSWQLTGGWKAELDTPGAIQMAHVTALFEPRPWYDLVPDQTHAVVTAGFGTFGLRDYVTAARTPIGALVMAYIPSATPGSSSRTVTVDMSRLRGPVTARWYGPAAGTFTSISGSPFANAGLLSFTTPGINADGPGNEDWVLVLEAAEPPRVSATVIPAGTRSGSVTSSPAGITCGTTCSASFASGSPGTPTPVPAAGSALTGRGGRRGARARPRRGPPDA